MDWGSLVNGVLGAYGAYQNAQQANKPRDTYTDQTSTSTPYGQNLTAPGIEGVYNYATNLMQQGPRYIGSGSTSGAGGGGQSGGGNGGSPPGQKVPAGYRVNARGQTVAVRNGGGGRGGAGGGQAAGAAGGGQITGITDLSNTIANRGLQAGNDPTTRAAQQGVQNILSGQGGADSGGTGYQGFNPILDAYAQQLGGDVSGDNSDQLIRNFLAGNYGQNGGSAGGGGGASSGGSGGWPAGAVAAGYGGYSSGHYGNGGSGGGIEPDSTASGGLFNDRVKQLLDQKANDADLQTVIDAQNADITRGMQKANWDLDAQAQGTGRFGGDMWKGLSNDERRNAMTSMANASAQTRLADQAQRQQMYEALLGQVNNRDIAAMNDATNRYGISTSAATAGAGNAAALAAQQRGQDLQALGMLLQNQQFNRGQYGDIGNALSQDQLGAINQSQGLAGIGLSGLGAANNAVGNLVGQLGANNSLRAAQISAGTQRAALNQQADIYNSELPWNNVSNYMNMIRGIGGMGGTTTTQGQNVVPGAGVNPYGAAALGGWAGYNGSR